MDSRSLWKRVDNLILSGWLVADRHSGGHRGQFAVHDGEVKGGIRILTPFGFAMRLVPGGAEDGAETVLLAIESNRRVALPPHDDRYAPDDLEAGEAALYNADDPDGGCRIHLQRGRVIKIICDKAEIEAGSLARISADDVQIHGRDRVAVDCNGYGFEWLAAGSSYQSISYTIGSVAATTVPVAPPDITPE
ncbi:MAG: phage baseplate assembly protein [Alphaproteobacteria bacterium]|nr:phage baseplate assembly protein [Alphaproteobacteria bacterium]